MHGHAEEEVRVEEWKGGREDDGKGLNISSCAAGTEFWGGGVDPNSRWVET